MGHRFQSEISISEAGTTDWLVLELTDQSSDGFLFNLDISGVATADVEYASFSNRLLPIQFLRLAERTKSTAAFFDVPAEAVRINVTDYTSGTITLQIMQGRNR